ncbi:MAG TPA: phenylalanine--tRNA ligase subunit beta, partial [Bacilli bacterium]|nr:phenylalanine--tRNA ligase subunit beta [Bacilli bacterium]
MKISCNVLKKYIKNSEKIDFYKIWDTFTIRTAEVEGVEVKGEDVKNVVVGEIVECNPHPKKEKYHILKVDNGEKIVDILCGAPNVKKGLKTPIVKVGGMVCGITIEPKEIAGVMSYGMLCSGKELGISDDQSGILELPDNYIVGKNINEYIPIKDIVVEIDNKSLTNRPDLWGHYGIAREIAAITGHELLDLPVLEPPKEGKKLDI